MVLRLEHVSHKFGKQQVLDDVSLTIETGDCYGFIGHNGAGKTTAMRVMLGLLQPDSGRVIIDGFLATEYPREARARMGALIEQSGFHPHWSGARNLSLLDHLAGGGSDIAALIEQVGLTHAGDKPVRAYSQGMRQRLGVAQALLGDPAYVLLDEPSNGLDPDGIQEMRELIRHLTQDQGRTVLISSHQLHELSGICNRVGVLRTGRLVMEETVENLLRSDVYQLNGTESIELAGRDPAKVLAELVSSGKRVESFAPKSPSLEEIYHRDAAPVAVSEPAHLVAPAEHLAKSRPVLRMIAHEFQRWAGQWTVPAMLTIPALAGALAMLIRKGQTMQDEAELAAGDLATASAVNAFEGVARALNPGVWLLGYIVLGLASQSVAGEFGQGTLRNVLLRPITRVQVALGKWAAAMLLTVSAYLFLACTSIALATWAFDWDGAYDILPNGEPFYITEASELWAPFWIAISSPIVPLMALATIGFVAGNLLRRSASALALAFGLGVAMDFGRGFFTNSAVEAWIPATYLPSPLGRTSYLDYFQLISNGTSTKPMFESTLVWASLLWVVAGALKSAWFLKRRYVP